MSEIKLETIYNKGKRTISYAGGSISPDQKADITPEEAKKLKRLFGDEIASLADIKVIDKNADTVKELAKVKADLEKAGKEIADLKKGELDVQGELKKAQDKLVATEGELKKAKEELKKLKK